jgi:hypothetical protein
MKDIGIVSLLSVIISAAAPNSPTSATSTTSAASAASVPSAPTRSFQTAKSIDQFASCFADTQDRSALAWWYVPKDDGGTFSNLGSRTLQSAYFVVVSDRGAKREVRLEGNGASEIAVNRAVSQCV